MFIDACNVMPTYEFSRRQTAAFEVVDSDATVHAVIEITTFERLMLRTGERLVEMPTRLDLQLATGEPISRIDATRFVSSDGKQIYFIRPGLPGEAHSRNAS